MVMDLVVLAIILVSALLGARKGFALTIISFMQWFVCLIIGIIFCPMLKEYLIKNTTIDEYINEIVIKQFAGSLEGSTSYNSLPDFLGSTMESGTKAVIASTAESITGIILTILSFLLIVVVIKIVCYFIARIFSKKYHHGLLGFLDCLGGFVVGFFRGGLFVYLAFAILVPLLGFISPDVSKVIMKSLNDSSFAGEIYNNNIILELIKNIFS